MSSETVTDIFKVLNNVDISGLTKKKGNFDYLSWSNAVREASKLFPEMVWEFTKWDSLPFLKTEVGYFVECTVTINGLSKTQMMAVLDFKNQTATAPKANDINKSQMRALTKAIALHGLGIDLWAGEDINGEYDGDGSKKVEFMITEFQAGKLRALLLDGDEPTQKGWSIIKAFKIDTIETILEKDYDKILKAAS